MPARLPAQARRDQLLAVALATFARQGFHATSMNGVADAAGVTKPVLYQHFASKRTLYLELLAHVGGRLITRLTAAVDVAESARDKVAAGFAAYFSWVDADRNGFSLLFGSGARRDAEFAEAVHEIERRIADHIAPYIVADITDTQRRVLAHGLVGMAEGASRLWVDQGLDLDPGQLACQVADLAWAGLSRVHRYA